MIVSDTRRRKMRRVRPAAGYGVIVVRKRRGTGGVSGGAEYVEVTCAVAGCGRRSGSSRIIFSLPFQPSLQFVDGNFGFVCAFLECGEVFLVLGEHSLDRLVHHRRYRRLAIDCLQL